MNKYDFIKDVAGKAGVTQNEAENIFNAMQKTISETLKSGDKISLKGFGVFKKLEKASRTGRNPKTGENITIPAKAVAKFSFSREFKID
jgi:DNA-binding protein HU-beta